jgi:D-inositol-3-phosphate glycosyltransferase
MTIFLDNPPMSRAMDRVTQALKLYAPKGTKIADKRENAEMELLHVIGYADTKAYIEKLKAEGKKYGIIQYCLRTSGAPATEQWMDLWRDAEIVWSYYDLPEIMAEEHQFIGGSALSKFYISPLGVDNEVFRPWPTAKKFAICTHGYVPEAEGVLEAMEAARQTGHRVFHLGPPDAAFGAHVHQLLGINDKVLAQQYSLCHYVAGLRRGEGFELPAAEGLLCGARPVMFDRPHYRKWFNGLAEFIPEGSPETVTKALVELFGREAPVITDAEVEVAKGRFDWEKIIGGFWETLRKPAAVLPQATPIYVRNQPKRKVLWIGDAGVSTGFARCTHRILDVVKNTWDVSVLGLNYYGDPHPYPYDIYPCITLKGNKGDFFGLGRVKDLIEDVRPDLMVVQNDPWNIPAYLEKAGNVPVIGFVAVDGKNCQGSDMNGLRAAIFWTKFGMTEALQGGYSGFTGIVPLGVDIDIYNPLIKSEARQALPFKDSDKEMLKDAFIIGNVNRNQPRKRLDLCVSIFAEWIRSRAINDAYLFLHVAPTGDRGYDLKQLAGYYGVGNKVIVITPDIGHGVSEQRLNITYNCFDVFLLTSQGEGWGLTAMEAMACGVPCVVPDNSAFTDWPGNSVIKIPCNEISVTPDHINVIGSIMDRTKAMEALDRLYQDRGYGELMGAKGYARVCEPQFRWENIGASFTQVLDECLQVEPVVAA